MILLTYRDFHLRRLDAINAQLRRRHNVYIEIELPGPKA